MPPPIRVVSIMESAFVTGPAKNLIGFAARAREGDQETPGIDLSIVALDRPLARRRQDIRFVTGKRISATVKKRASEGNER